MFIFTWIGVDTVKCTQTIKDPVGANTFYGILNKNPCIHNLKVLYKTETIETYIVFINDKAIRV